MAIKVNLTADLPNVGDFTYRTVFDISAYNWDIISNSPYFKPVLVDYTSDVHGFFAAIHPARRISWVNNVLEDSTDTTAAYDKSITWKQIGEVPEDGFFSSIKDDYDTYTALDFEEAATADLNTYLGPVWKNAAIEAEPNPNDQAILEEFESSIGESTGTGEGDGDEGTGEGDGDEGTGEGDGDEAAAEVAAAEQEVAESQAAVTDAQAAVTDAQAAVTDAQLEVAAVQAEAPSGRAWKEEFNTESIVNTLQTNLSQVYPRSLVDSIIAARDEYYEVSEDISEYEEDVDRQRSRFNSSEQAVQAAEAELAAAESVLNEANYQLDLANAALSNAQTPSEIAWAEAAVAAAELAVELEGERVQGAEVGLQQAEADLSLNESYFQQATQNRDNKLVQIEEAYVRWQEAYLSASEAAGLNLERAQANLQAAQSRLANAQTRRSNAQSRLNRARSARNRSMSTGIKSNARLGNVFSKAAPVDISNATATEPTPSPTPDADITIPSIGYVYQTRPKDKLWWCMESSSFLKDGMSFWVNLRMHTPPTTNSSDTLFIISIGSTDVTNRFEIYLTMNNRPMIFDIGESDGGEVLLAPNELDSELSRIWSTDHYHRIGVTTIGGRLIVIINGVVQSYARIDSVTGDTIPCKIVAGPVRLYGTNASCLFNVSPMTFAEKGYIALPIPEIPSDEGGGDEKYGGVDKKNEENDSVCILPSNDDAVILYGCDCAEFTGDGGDASPGGQGEIEFKKQSGEYEASPGTIFYWLKFTSSDIADFLGGTLSNGGCPYFFRLKGLHVKDEEPGETGEDTDITDRVISITESANAPDYYHTKKTLEVVIYGGLDTTSGTSGITVDWGGGKTFTGVITSFSGNDKAGFETTSIRAEDYFFILNANPIVNSPFYDGMIAVYALMDIAQRAGITNITNNWESEEDFFLKAGSAFEKPAMRFDGFQTLYDCILKIVKDFEAFVYFTGEGEFVISRLEGGLFADSQGSGINFNSDPDAGGGTIIEERQVETNYASTVNVITLMSVHRGNNVPIMHRKIADGSDNSIPFRKVHMRNEPSYGSMEIMRDTADQIAKRVFFPILKSRWKVAGSDNVVGAGSIVNVDGQKFRVMALTRSYNAETNDLTTSYEGEWKGGA